jgi:pimeloyl-ACP methyl ester carboxylesterase
VGHSYGGVVITEAADDPKVAGLVYIAAFAPDVGQSVGSLGASVEPAPMGAEVRPDAQGFLKLTEAGVKNDFAQDLTLTEKSILFAAQAPTAAAAFGENVSVASWKTKPSWYLVARADRAIQPSLERTMAKNIKAKRLRSRQATWLSRASPRDGEPDSGGGRDILAVFEIALGLTVVWCRIEESMSAMGARDHTAIAEQLKTEEGCER